MDEDDIIEGELVLRGRAVDQGQDAPIGEADAPAVASFTSRPGYHGRRHPVNIIKRQASTGECLLPERPPIGVVPVGFEAKYGGIEICLGSHELCPAVVAFVSGEAFLQRLLDRPL